MSKQKRLAYKVAFKLEVIKFAKEHGNRAAERHFGPPPTEKTIRDLVLLLPCPLPCSCFTPCSSFLSSVLTLVLAFVCSYTPDTRHRQNGLSVSTKMIIYEAKRIAVEKGIQDFTGSPSWCYRFMKRSGFSMRTKTRIAQKMPKEYESKILSFHKFKCGISNALDGTEDDVLFDTSEEESDDNDCVDLSFLISDSSEEEEFLGFE
uniref:HTH CENPB-type domain-containing protein n=1 Tax=Xenopus tropicalis TaxID=8364 RepID=A0A803J700_XENTR